tara:strand:+ start:426 stop:821 length:396 start_codon:yes stop_codon:yes gene_type:complete
MYKVNSFLNFIFYISVVILIIINLFPGSLLGFFIYKDLNMQPNLINNPFGTTINHFIGFFCVSILGLFLYLKKDKFKNLVFVLIFLSIILEILQLLVPNRSFEIYDLSANFIGVLFAFILVKIYKFLTNHE